MSNLTVDLFDSGKFFGNDLNNSQYTVNHSKSNISNENSIESVPDDSSADNGKSEDVAFQEILGQQLNAMMAQGIVNIQEPKSLSLETGITEISTEGSGEINIPVISVADGKASTNITIRDFGENSSIAVAGFEENTESSVNIASYSNIDIRDAVDNSDLTITGINENTVASSSYFGIQNFDKNSLKNTGLTITEASENTDNNINNGPDFFSIEDNEGKNADLTIRSRSVDNDDSPVLPFAFPSNSEGVENQENPSGVDGSQRKIFDNTGNHLEEKLFVQNVFPEKSNSSSLTEGFIENMGLNPSGNSHNTIQSKNTAQSENTMQSGGSISNIINHDAEPMDVPSATKELSREFKLFAQNISGENGQSSPASADSNPSGAINDTNDNTARDLTKIQQNEASSELDTSSVNRIKGETNSFNNLFQEQDASDQGALGQSLNRNVFFPENNQMDFDTTQSSAQNNQQNMFVSMNSTAGFSSPAEGPADNVAGHFATHSGATAENIQSNDIVEQIFQKIHLISNGDKSEIKIDLSPPELGSVKIHFVEKNDEIEATVFVKDEQVKAAIENNAHRLRESLTSSGVEIHKFEVFVQNDDASKQNAFEGFSASNRHSYSDNEGSRNREQYLNDEEETNNILQPENSINNSRLAVDYII